MEITRIQLERFKKVGDVTIDLSPINILVGGNNSGKSSVLEGLHFSVVASVAARLADTKTFTQDALLFCPTKEFVNLRNGAPYKNQSNFGYLRVYATDNEDELDCIIKIYRGRNEGNVGCELSGSANLRRLVSSSQRPFSVYVPGLSGIPQVEECRTESIIRRGVASGDANLYLRNVLLLINDSGKLQELIAAVKVVFPTFHLSVEFKPKTDLHIAVSVSLTGPYGRKTPLELVGTGVQQALQIFSYVVLFRPYLLLLDEPDSHLHPDNQGLLSKALLSIASTTDTKVIISTHSRHLVDALYDESNIVWLKNGSIHQQGDGIGRVPLLMDLGALDSFEKIREGEVDWVFLTEDASLEFVKVLIRESGFDEDEIVTYSYKTSSNIQSALALTEFILEIAPGTKVIIHRDKDFMTDEEVGWTEQVIENSGAIPFITEGSDIEYYFQISEHLAELIGVGIEEIETWKSEIAHAEHNTLVHKYLRKRDEVKSLYRNRAENPPDSMGMLGAEMPLSEEKRLGKFMLRKLRGTMHERFGTTFDVKTHSDFLRSEKLANLHDENAA
jgi:energy-coupling factor transporter ATP-binding protein EcfA2